MKIVNHDCESYIYKTETIGYYLHQTNPDSGIESFKKIIPVLDDIYRPDLDNVRFKYL